MASESANAWIIIGSSDTLAHTYIYITNATTTTATMNLILPWGEVKNGYSLSFSDGFQAHYNSDSQNSERIEIGLQDIWDGVSAQIYVVHHWTVNHLYVNYADGDDSDEGFDWTRAFATVDKGATTIPDSKTLHIAFGLYDAEPENNDIAPTNLTSSINYVIEDPNDSATLGAVQIGTDYPSLYPFEYTPWGHWVGFWHLGTLYFEGYQAADTPLVSSNKFMFSDPDEVNYGGSIAINDDSDTQVYAGSGIILEDLYVLNVVSISENGDAYISLTLDGVEVDDDIISPGDTYIYAKTWAGISNMPMIAVHLNTTFYGGETVFAVFDGIWQVFDDYTTF